jgi:hypothetical protein
MKLDRNENDNGLGKYAILKLRELAAFRRPTTFGGYPDDIEEALRVLERRGILDWGVEGTEAEFFLIRLKDKYAQAALYAYAEAIVAEPDCAGDAEYAQEIVEMGKRAGADSPWCKKPD